MKGRKDMPIEEALILMDHGYRLIINDGEVMRIEKEESDKDFGSIGCFFCLNDGNYIC